MEKIDISKLKFSISTWCNYERCIVGDGILNGNYVNAYAWLSELDRRAHGDYKPHPYIKIENLTILDENGEHPPLDKCFYKQFKWLNALEKNATHDDSTDALTTTPLNVMMFMDALKIFYS